MDAGRLELQAPLITAVAKYAEDLQHLRMKNVRHLKNYEQEALSKYSFSVDQLIADPKYISLRNESASQILSVDKLLAMVKDAQDQLLGLLAPLNVQG